MVRTSFTSVIREQCDISDFAHLQVNKIKECGRRSNTVEEDWRIKNVKLQECETKTTAISYC